MADHREGEAPSYESALGTPDSPTERLEYESLATEIGDLPAVHVGEPDRRQLNWRLVAGIVAVTLVALLVGVSSYLFGVITSQNAAFAAALTQSQQGKKTPTPEQIRKDPAVVNSPAAGPSGPAGQPGANATDAQVRAAVAVYFAAHPIRDGKDASPVDIAAAVANYLSQHPPAQGTTGAQGPGPTADQVADAVSAYLSAHPPERGPQGEQGPAGANATAEQVSTAVREYVEAHPLPLCPSGYTAKPVTVATVENGLPTGQAKIVACLADS